MSDLIRIAELVDRGSFESTVRRLVLANAGTLEDFPPPPAPLCATCRDSGWLRVDVPVGHPHFGNPMPCPDCDLVAGRRRRRLLAASGIPEAMRGYTLAGFAEATGKRGLIETIRARRDDPALVFVGPVGVGKTGITAALLLEAIGAGTAARLVSAPGFFARLKASYDRGHAAENEAAIMAELAAVPRLALDDIGRGEISEWGQERMFSLICERLGRPGLQTIVTSNLDGSSQGLVDHVWPATFDRLRGAARPFIRISGESLRGVA